LGVRRSGAVFDLDVGPVFFLGAAPGPFLLGEIAEQNAEFLVDLIAPFDELSCTRELVVEHGNASFKRSVVTFTSFVEIPNCVRK
jgi:hypothetical protein